jgi:hypothetical protein
LAGGDTPGWTSPPTVLADVVLIPGKLTARIVLVDFDSASGSVPCWVYVTDGLRAVGQSEIAFTLRRSADEAPKVVPSDPLGFFATVHGFAEQGRIVHAGGFTQFDAGGFMGDPSWRGFAYVPNHPGLVLPAPPDALVAIALMGVEMDVVKQHGATRITAQLGRAARHYPFQAWSERGRPPVFSPAALEESILTRVPTLRLSGTTAVKIGDHITLRIPPAAAAKLRSALASAPPERPFGLLCELDPGADACLVWQPGQRGPKAISAPGSRGERVSGCFVVFAGEQDGDAGQVFEDGFAFMLRNASFTALRRALGSGAPLDLPAAAPGMGLSLTWG